MKRLTVAAALSALTLAAPLPVIAQDLGPAPVMQPGNTLLSLNAEGRTTRQPDLALFTAGVASTGKTAGDALSANSAAMNRVIQALKRAGIAERDIQTSNLSLQPVYAERQRLPDGSFSDEEPRITGYRVSNTVSVKQRKLDQFGRVIDTLVSAGANQVNGPDFQIDKPDAALDEARTDAVTKARGRANLYARAAGLKVVRILSITESGGYTPRPQAMYARVAMAEDASAPTPIEAGELEVQANVTVTFELAP